MKIKSGIYDIYETGSVISMRNNPIDFMIEDLLFRFSFIDDPSQGQNFLKAEPLPKGQKGLTLFFYNYNNSLGTGNIEPIPLGWIGNRNLYMNYRVYALQAGVDKLVHYTWYLGEVRNGK